MILTNVDLPAPFIPTIAIRSPYLIENEILFKIGFRKYQKE